MEKLLLKIANILYINMQYVPEHDLLKGKMGLTLFFYEYGRYTGNTIYSDTADILLDEIIAALSLEDNEALIGIGWGIQYLMKNNFVEGDPDEVLSEIDERVQQILTNYGEIPTEECERLFIQGGLNLFIDSYILSRSNSRIRDLKNMKYITDFYYNILLKTEGLLPLSFLNTCYAFLSCVSPHFIDLKKIGVLTKVLNDRCNQSLVGKLYKENDLKFLMRIKYQSQINLLNKDMIVDYVKTIDSYLNYFICELLYFDSDCCLLDNHLVNSYISDVINNVTSDNLSLNGLAGIGLMIIKTKKS